MTLLFDAALDQLAARSASSGLGLQRVAVGEDTLTFQVPSGLEQGTRLRFTVRFADGLPPESVSLMLVVDAAHAQASAVVPRHGPGAQGCEQALAARDTRLATLQEELRDKAGSLTELISTGVLGETGVRVVPIKVGTVQRLTVMAALLYVAHGRMAVEVLLKVKKGARPWVPRTAQLTIHAAPVAVRRLLLEGSLRKFRDTARLIVEWDAPGAQPEDPPPPYALDVSEQNGGDTLRIPCLSSALCGAQATPGKK